MDNFNMHSYQCKNCMIVSVDSDGGTLTLNCLNGYSRARIVFKGVSHISSPVESAGTVIQSIETVNYGNDTTAYVLNFQDSVNRVEIVAKSKEYIEL